ncbi:MAG TPA: peptidoglycan DD-metalloendopeptidase family protein [Anaerolineales bacterium]
MSTLAQLFSRHRFSVLSWAATLVLVATLLGVALGRGPHNLFTGGASSVPPAPLVQDPGSLQLPNALGPQIVNAGISRGLALKTTITGVTNAKPITYRVMQGDSVFGIAKQYNIKPDSILYSNEATLNDNPSNLTPGMELVIPPVDGLTYTWKEGDTLESVANQFKADLNKDDKIDEADAELLREAIVSWPSNDLDLTDPEVKAGQMIMVPGGHRELVSWLEFVPTTNRSGTTATSELGGSGCAAGPGSPPGIWPTNGPHTLSGNNYSGSHLGIDITATTSTAVLASGGGVVVFAGFSQYGYGNVVQIDHLDGFATVYAHLSQINVSQCEVVYGGEVIGMAGSTGNSTGVHLHFEVRQGNVNMNPWSIVQ